MEKLTQCLKNAERARRRSQGASLFLKAIKYLFAAFIILLASDVIFHLDSDERLLSLGCYAGLLGLFLTVLIYRSFIASRNLKAIARDIELKDPEAGSSLINTLDLKRQIADGEIKGNSLNLAEQAIKSYSDRVDQKSFITAIVPKNLGRDIKWAAMSILLLFLCLLPVWSIFQLELMRFFDPYGDHPAYSLTKLEITSPADDSHKVIYGESLIVKAEHSGHRPDELFLTFHPVGKPAESVTLPMFNKGEMGFSQKIENVKEETVVYVHNSSHRAISKKRKIGIILTPKLEKAYVTVTPPSYTGIKAVRKEYKWKNIRALSGSKISFTLESNRPLKNGTVEKTSSGETEKIKMTAEENSVTGSFELRANSRLRFRMYDVSGLESKELLKGSVTATYDRPPAVNLIVPDKNSFVTDDFVLKIKFQATDDYGIKQMRLHRALNGFYGPPLVFAPKEKYQTSITQVAPVVIKDLGVKPGDVISIFADTLDNSPQGQAAVTPVIQLQVISVEEYNDYLRQRADVDDIKGKYEKLRDTLTDLVEEQKKVNREIAALKKQVAEGKPPKDLEDKLTSLIKKQGELNSKLGKLAKEMKEFGREKPLYDIEKDLEDMLKETAKKIDKSIAENESSLKEFSAAANSQNSQKSLVEALEKLEKAGQQQKEKLDTGRQEYTDRVLSTLLDLSLMNALVRDFNRFTQIYKLQTALVEKVKRYNIIRELSHTDKITLKRLASDEKFIKDQLEKLRKDLLFNAEEAVIQFPKASESARKLAEKIKEARLTVTAEQSLNSMLIPDGPESYQLAEKLRADMEKFFEEPQLGAGMNPGEPNPYLKEEFDKYLNLMLGMNSGNTFEQMSQCRKLGMGRNGRGTGSGRGSGASEGTSGSGYNEGPQIGLLGNEQLGQGKDKGQGDGRNSRGSNDPGSNELVAIGGSKDSRNRKSDKNSGDSVNSETLINEYESIIEAYFEKLTEEE